jgi:hypothetical protein
MAEPEQSSGIVDHLPLFVGILTALFIASRILSIADFSPETAYAILQASGSAAVVVGAGLQFLPVIPPAFGLTYLAFFLNSGSDIRKLRKPFNIFIIASIAIFSVFVTPLAVLVTALFGVLAGTLISYIFWVRLGRRSVALIDDPERSKQQTVRKQVEGAQSVIKIIKITTIIILAFYAAFFIFSTAPWLPAQYLQVRGKVIVGYVLSSGPSYYTVLENNPRRVVYISLASVNKQSFCGYVIPWDAETLPSFFFQQIIYPTCPSTTYEAARSRVMRAQDSAERRAQDQAAAVRNPPKAGKHPEARRHRPPYAGKHDR